MPGLGLSFGNNDVAGKVLYKCWAAVRGDTAVQCISMRVPSDVDFNSYREAAIDCLSLLGDVKSGELIERDDGLVFVKRKTHVNRSRRSTPRPAMEYRVTNHD